MPPLKRLSANHRGDVEHEVRLIDSQHPFGGLHMTNIDLNFIARQSRADAPAAKIP
jgi:hypothetical protein